ncbi:uncharacterized protein BDZ99DRAFT_514017 [Mytilinidion resinicola]|uniref:BTB domain-containing protein n=1 Tax=Mytilinidion resinicola TaxID=574789 RepID=A0A6A6ZAS4_9PEZI|nr:uncharacterized protein BDZ99DRAFT_514017 [Mytilinidion resinicola]KAF2817803.1 hypothetical protein BDZ99DRAFT_514017 [Mytilinidion resinicola]
MEFAEKARPALNDQNTTDADKSIVTLRLHHSHEVFTYSANRSSLCAESKWFRTTLSERFNISPPNSPTRLPESLEFYNLPKPAFEQIVAFFSTGVYDPHPYDSGNEDPVAFILKLHFQLYHLARVYQVPELERLAFESFKQAVAAPTSTPARPYHTALAAAIRCHYEYVATQDTMGDLMVNIGMDSSNGFVQSEEFRRLIDEVSKYAEAVQKNLEMRYCTFYGYNCPM